MIDKVRWTDFLASKLKTQIALEHSEKVQTWVLGLLSLATLGFALNSAGHFDNRSFIQTSKVMFLLLFQILMAVGIFLPALLQKSDRPLAKMVGARDFTGLIMIASALFTCSLIVMLLSVQILSNLKTFDSALFGIAAWMQLVLAVAYALFGLFFFISMAFSPSLLAKILGKAASKIIPILLICHGLVFFGMGPAYLEVVKMGSAAFYEQFFATFLFWIAIYSGVSFLIRLYSESAIPALSALEWEAVTGKLERPEDLLIRYKEAFISKRLSCWMNRLSHRTATRAHEIAQYAHRAVQIVNQEKPSEIDLRQVEECYKRSEVTCQKLEKEYQRFQAIVSLTDLSEVEAEKVAKLHDQFSRESRNARLELASVRKRLDEKLVALKNTLSLPVSTPVQMPAEKAAASRPMEELPLSR